MRRSASLFAVVFLGVAVASAGCTTHDGDSPDVRPTSGAHASQILRDCLQTKGWSAEVDDIDGGVSSEIPAAQESQYLDDVTECTDEFRLNDFPEPTREQYEAQYTKLVEAAACLADLGYETPPPPSMGVFVDSRGVWSPFALLPETDADEFNELVRQCPQPQMW